MPKPDFNNYDVINAVRRGPEERRRRREKRESLWIALAFLTAFAVLGWVVW